MSEYFIRKYNITDNQAKQFFLSKDYVMKVFHFHLTHPSRNYVCTLIIGSLHCYTLHKMWRLSWWPDSTLIFIIIKRINHYQEIVDRRKNDKECFARWKLLLQEYNVWKEFFTHITVNQAISTAVYCSIIILLATWNRWPSQVHGQLKLNYSSCWLLLYVLMEKPNKTGYHWICYKASATNPNDKVNHYNRTFTHVMLAHSPSVHFDVVLDTRTKQSTTSTGR